MAYLNTTTSAYPLSEAEIRALFTQTSFGTPFVAPEPYVWVFPTPAPPYSSVTHSVREVAPELTQLGHYEQRWEVVELQPSTAAANLEMLRLRTKALFNAERDRREEAGFGYLGKVFDSDSRSVQRITVSVQAAQAALAVGAPFSVEWTTQDNSKIILDAAQMMGVPVALAQYADALHVHASARKAQIAAATEAELLVFDVMAGWPT